MIIIVVVFISGFIDRKDTVRLCENTLKDKYCAIDEPVGFQIRTQPTRPVEPQNRGVRVPTLVGSFLFVREKPD